MHTAAPIPNSRSVKRRSVRVQLTIRLSIEAGDVTVLNGETITVSKHGARIRVIPGEQGTAPSKPRRLTHGERLRVTVCRGQEQQQARVVWLDKRSDMHYGIELDNPGNFWGVNFPSKDSNWRSERKEMRRVDVVPPSATPEPQPAPQLVAELVAEEEPEPAPLIKIGRMPAVVAGLSAIGLPFVERVEMVFDEPEEGTALVQKLVEPGAQLRISFPHLKTKGRVIAIGRSREAGKWRVRIKCEAHPRD
jgi:hypothetical protein